MSKVWFITGSSRGLGKALAEAVLAAGHKLVATARNPKQLDDLVHRYGQQILPVALDVAYAEAATKAVQAAINTFGRIDVVVNNAGYANVDSFEDMTTDDFDEQFNTNFFGVVNVTRAVLPVLHKQHSGHIIQISSIGGRGATPGLSAYQAAKWAVGGFSGVLAKEVAPLGIKVTVVEPGGMATDWAGPSMQVGEIKADYLPTVGILAKMRGQNPERSDPAKVAQAILQLASEKEPPLRLLIGSDAFFLADLFLKARAAEDAKWKPLSVSTDFDGMEDFSETAIAKALVPKGVN